MGYCMTKRYSSITILKEKFPEMVKAIHALFRGKDKPYSWVNRNFNEYTNVQDLFEAWRWDVDFDDAGNIVDISFLGEKLGDDQIFFETIAPFVERDSCINMEGEDGSLWQWCFDGEKMTEKTGRVIFE